MTRAHVPWEHLHEPLEAPADAVVEPDAGRERLRQTVAGRAGGGGELSARITQLVHAPAVDMIVVMLGMQKYS
jgi:hypothetical protein